jgi:predicted PurR-regulated permease PerM
VVLVVVQFFLVLFTTFYLLRDGRKLMEGVRAASPLTRTQTDTIVAHTRTIISASLQGTVLIAAIQGVLGGIAFVLVGIPAALLWMPVMFMTSLIPIVGSSIIWGPAALYLLLGGSWGKALFLAIWGVGVIGMLDNVLRPILVGSRTRMHELVVLFSVLGGLQFFGPVGIVVGPMTVAAAQGLMRIFIEEASAEGEKA